MAYGPSIAAKLEKASLLFQRHFSGTSAEEGKHPEAAVAPGRVNLIGEHTDYTGGFVLPFAIDYATLTYGTGSLKENTGSSTCASLTFVSTLNPDKVVKITLSSTSQPPDEVTWANYVAGTVFQYLNDLPKSSTLELTFVICGDVPLGSGLSSSASLEVSVARFVESIIGEDHAFSSEDQTNLIQSKVRALRCQKAENEWCRSPCGIMDQYVSSAAKNGSLLLIDCSSLEFKETKMAELPNKPVIVVANSNVQHDIAGGEYPIRVEQCKIATKALKELDPKLISLRKASISDVEKAKPLMDTTSYNRAKHVVTENSRTLEAKDALEKGDWVRVGKLMNDSHTSMRDDYEVSCKEIDILVDIASSFDGVYGSRLTGGGFGGCTVTLVDRDQAPKLIDHMKSEYKSQTGKDCFCFETEPANGAFALNKDDL